ncbi:hypothetical protein DL96DRAFT_320200 [Flagelloscypha sp. PMI_526]|nr:hypothetical protein DL96DRAFT_320200 [Flagelloscypha sp. PMI_526]
MEISSSYVVGTPTRHTLNLDDVMAFPDNNSIPLRPPDADETWIWLFEVTTIGSKTSQRHVYHVVDKTGTSIPVEFDLSKMDSDAVKRLDACKVGDILALKNVIPTRLGGVPFRMNHASLFEVVPVNFLGLRALNTILHEKNKQGTYAACWTCGTDTEKKCSKCGARYCSPQHQKSDWPNHKLFCPILKVLYKWNIIEYW